MTTKYTSSQKVERPRQRVMRVDQSPMNPVIWILELACGHDITVTQKSRPDTMSTFKDRVTGERMTGYKMVECWRCKEAAKKGTP